MKKKNWLGWYDLEEEEEETKVFNGVVCTRSAAFPEYWYDINTRTYYNDDGSEAIRDKVNKSYKPKSYKGVNSDLYGGFNSYGKYSSKYIPPVIKSAGAILADEIDDLVNPYAVDENTKSDLKSFADMLSPTYDVTFKEGDEWKQDWEKNEITYSINSKMRKIESQSLMLNALASLRRGKPPELHESSKLNVKRSVETSDSLSGTLGPKKRERILFRLRRQLILKRIIGRIDETRTGSLIPSEFSIGKKTVKVLSSHNIKQAKKHRKLLTKVKKKLRETKAGALKDVFKPISSSSTIPLRSNVDLREKVRDLLIHEAINGYLYGMDRRGWIKQQNDVVRAMNSIEDKLRIAKNTADISAAIGKAYYSGLKSIIEGSELTDDETADYDGSSLPRDSVGDILKGESGNSAFGEKAADSAGKIPVTLSAIAEQLRRKIRDMFVNNDRRKFYGRHRSGKLLTRELYKHRNGKFNLFQRRTVNDDKRYHVLITVDVSGSTSGRIFAEEVKSAVVLIRSCIGIDKIRFTLNLFDTRVIKIFSRLTAKEGMEVLKSWESSAFGGTAVFGSGGTDIRRALRELYSQASSDEHNISFILTDGYDEPSHVMPQWKKMIKGGSAWAFVYGRAEATGTFGDINVSNVRTPEEFVMSVKSALSRILKNEMSD